MDLDRITYIGATDARGRQQAFGIKSIDRAKHMYIIGKTGMGKSVFLENMAIQDIQHGEGLAFIDPHGSTAEKLLDFVPEHRIEDVVYFAPFDMSYPLAFNVMEDVGYDKRHLVVSGLMSAFKKIWVDAWSARMEYILSNTLLALLEYPDSTLLDVNKMLVNKNFRKKVVDYVTDPIVKSFWAEEFAGYSDRYTQDATPAIQNKIGQFTSNPLIRNIVGQGKSSFDMREIMDTKKIFIANLSKGQMGEQNADLIGSMLTTKIYLSAMSRADESAIEQAKLPPFYFYVDEFQSIANDSFADILSEARKYKLALTIAHQYIAQMEDNVRDAVFGNAGTIIAFRVGPFDAEVLETIFKPRFLSDDIVNLGKYQVYLTLMIDGAGSVPFSASTLPPINEPEVSFKEQIIEASRRTYGAPRESVEAMIWKRNESDAESPQPAQSQKKNPSGGTQRAPLPARATGENTAPRPREKKSGGNMGATQQNPLPKEKKTVSLGALKLKQQAHTKGPSPEQRSALKDALAQISKSADTEEKKEGPEPAPTPKKNPASSEKQNPQPAAPETPQAAPQQHTPENPAPPSQQKEVPKEVLEKILQDK